MQEFIDKIKKEHEIKSNKYTEYKKTHEYLSEEKYFDKISRQFQKITSLLILTYMSGLPTTSRDSFYRKFSDDQLLSIDAIKLLVNDGIYNSAKRELRYMLEYQLKILYVDQLYFSESIDSKLKIFENQIQKINIFDNLEPLTFIGFDDETKTELINEVKNTYSKLCEYVHYSWNQVDEHNKLKSKSRLMTSSAKEFRNVNQLFFRTYDILLCLCFNCFDQTIVGDFIVGILDDIDNLSFSKGKYYKKLSLFFDYKTERQNSDYRKSKFKSDKKINL